MYSDRLLDPLANQLFHQKKIHFNLLTFLSPSKSPISRSVSHLSKSPRVRARSKVWSGDPGINNTWIRALIPWVSRAHNYMRYIIITIQYTIALDCIKVTSIDTYLIEMEFIEKMLPRMQDILNVMDIKGLKGLGLRDLYTHERLQ